MIVSNRLLVAATALVVLTVTGALSASASSLSIATNYNVFLGGSFTSQNTDVAGRAAVGGSMAVSNFGLVGRLNASANGTDTLIVGGDLNAPNTQLYYGNAYAGSVTTAPSLMNPGAQSIRTTGGDPIDFTSTMSALQTYSYMLAGLSDDNSELTTLPWQETVVATAPGLNVITVDNSFFSNSRSLNITLGANSTLLINVVGNTFDGARAGITINGSGLNGDNTTSAAGRILWNMPDVTSFAVYSSGFAGTVLAPKANVTAAYSQFSGTLIANNYSGNTEFHLNNFAGTLPDAATPTPEPASFALMGAGLGGVALWARLRRRRASRS